MMLMQDFSQITVPEEFESERLIIRTPRPGDGTELNAAIRESFAELSQWLPWAKQIPSVEETEANCAAAFERYKAKTDFRLIIFLKGTSTIVGACGLHGVDWNVPRFDIGYWVRTGCSGNGYITEAVRATADFAFNLLGARRVSICMDSCNDRSRAVAERAGFIYEGTLRNEARRNDGQLRDLMVYSKVRREET
jgi:RimJ/RimL family protein N-acetyltransferase